MSEEVKVTKEILLTKESETASGDIAKVAENEATAAVSEVQKPAEPVETMADYAKELEASYRRVREGDVLTGTVIGVTDDQVILDLKYYTEGIIDKDNLSNDPDFVMKESVLVGDEITATVIKTDDGAGHILLSKKEANDRFAWDKLNQMKQDRTVIAVKISQIVNGGAVAFLEGIRGFIPASKLDAAYVENLEEWDGKTLEVTVITAEEEDKKLVLSGKEVAREKLMAEKSKQIAKCEVGAVMDGTVETLKEYGAFVVLENGLSGLLHISQISSQRIKHPGVVLKEGQKITVKIISTADNKISLSMKALEEDTVVENDGFEYKEEAQVSTGLGALLSGFKF